MARRRTKSKIKQVRGYAIGPCADCGGVVIAFADEAGAVFAEAHMESYDMNKLIHVLINISQPKTPTVAAPAGIQ